MLALGLANEEDNAPILDHGLGAHCLSHNKTIQSAGEKYGKLGKPIQEGMI
jgi:hypothetical protein